MMSRLLHLATLVATGLAAVAPPAAPAITSAPALSAELSQHELARRQCVKTTYVVQPGDTLSAIAANMGAGVCNIASENNIPEVDTIYGGQTLTVPLSVCGAVSSATFCCIASAAATTHVAVSGDSFYGLGIQNGVPAASIASANTGIASANIMIGQVITIPARPTNC
ncbi:uncharacterized protein JN550_003128 [Neoarthrinium moseri]|uniref:uncharacterized protein n=1 Tax=Neoarthrinium moseri TaxID=1658444 RepID=UPI001FDE2773|nr:uncharacterized protein JN550_003128 [Neoarthrinium moseri]KAI1873859.1 hypothetical protein JN550_003128 [Neoarthrinium moseri]